MSRPACPTLAAILFLISCSEAGEKEPPVAILCAAEALHQARVTSGSLTEEDNLRARANLFTEKLPVAERQKFWTKIDQLADQRGAGPLVAASSCDALLTHEDRRALKAAAVKEVVPHDGPIGNGP